MDADDHRVAALAAFLSSAGCVFAEEEAALILAEATTPGAVDRMARERAAGTPLEHVLGWVDFAGFRVPLDRGVFVPRHRSEFLVECAVDGLAEGSTLVDLCCGSGAVAAAIATRVPVVIHAVDIDSRAVDNARRTLAPWGAQVYLGDLWRALPDSLRGGVDTVVIVAPYVPTDEIGLLPRDARDFEPRVALDGGEDGLSVLRLAIAGASAFLAPGGRFLTEVAEHQAAAVVNALERAGLSASIFNDDEATVFVGQKSPTG